MHCEVYVDKIEEDPTVQQVNKFTFIRSKYSLTKYEEDQYKGNANINGMLIRFNTVQ